MSAREATVAVSVPLTPTRSDLYWRRIFNKYDHDNDGTISYTELKSIIESREYEHDIPDAVVEKIMQLADKDNSGHLDFAEFVEMMHHPELKAVFGHFVARYIHCLIAPRSHVDTTATHSTTSIGLYPLRRLGQVIEAKRSETDRSSRVRSERTTTTTVMAMSSASRGTSTRVSKYDMSTDTNDDWKSVFFGVQSRSKSIFTYTDGRYEEQYTCWPPAICMLLISIAEIVMYCIDAAHGHVDARGKMAAVLIYNPHKRWEAWRFITYMFVHVGTVHLLVNLLVQLFLGVPLEMVHRWWRVLLVYAAGVVAGSLGTSLTDPGVYLAGASGGVYALIAAHISTIIMNWHQMDFAIVQMCVFVLLAAVDIGTAVYNRYFLQLEENIGYVAHLAGAVAGLLVGIGVLRNLEVNSWEKRLWWAAVVLYFLLMFAAVMANIFWTSHFAQADSMRGPV